MKNGAVARGLCIAGLGILVVVVLASCRPSISIGPAETEVVEAATEEAQPTVTMEVGEEATEEPTEEATEAATTAAAETTTAAANAGPGSQCTVTARSLNMRRGPGTNFPVVGGLSNGQTVTAAGRNQDNTWLNVRTADGAEGWASLRFLQCNPPSDGLPVAPAP